MTIVRPTVKDVARSVARLDEYGWRYGNAPIDSVMIDGTSPGRHTMTSITEYVKEKGITVEVVAGPAPSTEDGWNHYMYQVQLKRRGSIENDLAAGGEVASPDFIWNQGTGIETTPDERPDEVLGAVVSDATSYLQARDFEDFAEELGYDSDSRKAEKIYKACEETAEWLRIFLNGDLDYVAYELERL